MINNAVSRRHALVQLATIPSGLSMSNLGGNNVEQHQQRLSRIWSGYYQEHGQNERRLAAWRIQELGATIWLTPTSIKQAQLLEIQALYHTYLANIAREQMLYPFALSQLQKAVAIGKETKNHQLTAMALFRCHLTFQEMGEYSDALARIQEAHAFIDYTHPALRHNILMAMGRSIAETSQDTTDISHALSYLDQAGSLVRKDSMREDPYFLNASLGDYHLRRSMAYLTLAQRPSTQKQNLLSDCFNEIVLARQSSHFARRQALITRTEAEMYSELGEYKESIRLALQTIPEFAAIQSKIALQRIVKLYKKLTESNYSTSPWVRKLALELQQVGIPVD